MPAFESFDALATRVLPPLLDEVIVALAELSEHARPDQVKPLRKLLGKLRDHLDLFAPVYPASPDFHDGWVELRGAVDEGYDALGALKDLHDVQDVARPEDARYDRAELRRRRARVHAWRTRFDELVERARALLAHGARPDGWRKRSGLSSRYWGTPGPRARPDQDALANLTRLVRWRLREAHRAWQRAVPLRHLHRRGVHDRFHDARKRTRSLVRLFEWFPELTSTPAQVAPRVEALAELVVASGKILDRVNAYRIARAAGDRARRRELVDEIAWRWRKLRRWAARHEVEPALRELRRSVRRM